MTEEKEGGAVSLIKKRYDENPFIVEGGFTVPLRKRSEVIETRGPASVVVDGQQIAVAQIRQIKTVDSDRFVKLFVGELRSFFDLKPTALKILTVLINELSQARYMNGDTVMLNHEIVEEFFTREKAAAPSKTAFYTAVEELIQKGFIAPAKFKPLFYINPAIFFNGDRVQFVKEFRRKRATEQAALEAAGQRRLFNDTGEG